jgi:hypothetical protein
MILYIMIVLLRRSSRIILVVESSVDTFNQQAVLRTGKNQGELCNYYGKSND